MAAPFRTLSNAQRAEVETLAAVLNAQQMADYFGIGRTTLFAIMQREPEIAERYKRGKAKAVGAIAQSLIQKARSGDTACMIFYLKCQAGWRETAFVEHATAEEDGSPGRSAVDQVRAFLDEKARRSGDVDERPAPAVDRIETT